jgi:hypothetical protein
MQIWNYNKDGVYTGTGYADLDPMNPGGWLIPADATTVPVNPEVGSNIRVFNGTEWGYIRVGAEDEEPTAEPAPPTDDEITAERDRRIGEGARFTIGETSVPIQGRLSDQIILIGLKSAAMDYKLAGVTDAVLPFRDAFNAMHMFTPDEMIQLVSEGLQWVSYMYQKSWELKDHQPHPEDYTNDQYWI